MASPLLQYAFTTFPFPLQASPTNGNAEIATLTVIATNATSSAVSLEGFSIKIPVGADATDLTVDPSKINQVPPDGWKPAPSQTSPGFITFIFQPNSSPASLGPNDSLTFELGNITVNEASGDFCVTVTEGSTGNPTQTVKLTKFPAGWGNVTFTANPPIINAGQSTTLNWDGPPGATYTIEYYTPQTGIVNVPAAGQPPLSNEGEYPGQGQPPLTLQQTTMFYLSVTLAVGTQTYSALQQMQVTVAEQAPVITLFTGTVTQSGNQWEVALQWKSTGDSCLLTGNPAQLEASGNTTITASTSTPLLAQYTLTSQNQVGTATSTLTLSWQIQTSLSFDMPMCVLLSADQTRVYVLCGSDGTNSGDGSLVMLNRSSLQPIGTPVKMAIDPIGLAVSADGTRAYVSNDASYNLNVIDTSSGQLALLGAAVPLGSEPMTLGISLDGTKVFAANADDGTVSALGTSGDPNNPIASNQTIQLGVTGMGSAIGLAMSSDGKYVFAGANQSIVTIAVSTLSVVGNAAPLANGPSSPSCIAVTPDGSYVVVGVGEGYGFNGMQSFKVAAPPTVLQPAGQYSIDSSLTFQAVAAAPGSNSIYVVTEDQNLNGAVTIVDVGTMQAVGTPLNGVGQLPTWVTVSLDGTNLYVTTNRDGKLWLLTPASFAGGTPAATRQGQRKRHESRSARV